MHKLTKASILFGIGGFLLFLMYLTIPEYKVLREEGIPLLSFILSGSSAISILAGAYFSITGFND